MILKLKFSFSFGIFLLKFCSFNFEFNNISFVLFSARVKDPPIQLMPPRLTEHTKNILISCKESFGKFQGNSTKNKMDFNFKKQFKEMTVARVQRVGRTYTFADINVSTRLYKSVLHTRRSSWQQASGLLNLPYDFYCSWPCVAPFD